MSKGNRKEIWPNFFIVGAMRAGTTSLYHALKAHQLVYMSPIKEPCYFSDGAPNRISKKDSYLELFQEVSDEVAIGEASPYYLWDQRTPERIHDVIQQARIIIILRDPVERAFSHWFMMFNHWQQESLPFSTALGNSIKNRREMKHYFELGFYSEQVQRYLSTFGSEYVKTIIFEEFIQDTQASVTDILRFLQVPLVKSGASTRVYNRSNATIPSSRVSRRLFHIPKVARSILPSAFRRFVRRRISKRIEKPSIEPRDRKLLQDLYRDDVKKLSVILKRPLPWSWANNES